MYDTIIELIDEDLSTLLESIGKRHTENVKRVSLHHLHGVLTTGLRLDLIDMQTYMFWLEVAEYWTYDWRQA